MLNKIMIICPFALAFLLYYDLVGMLLFTSIVFFLEWTLGK